jgi:hypothetical protein
MADNLDFQSSLQVCMSTLLEARNIVGQKEFFLKKLHKLFSVDNTLSKYLFLLTYAVDRLNIAVAQAMD